jgi:hypothetical protein
LINLLLEARANPWACDWDGNTPLFMAAFANRPVVAKRLQTVMMPSLSSLSSTSTMPSSSVEEKVTSASSPATMKVMWSNGMKWPWGSDDMPSREWIHNKVRLDQERARWRAERTMDPQPPLTSFHVIPSIWSRHECQNVWAAVMRAVDIRGWSDNRHRAYNTTDIQASDVPEIDTWLRQSIRQRVFPQMLSLYFGQSSSADAKVSTLEQGTTTSHQQQPLISSKIRLAFRDLFFVKYEAAPGTQSSLDVHRDGSLLSFNILLNDPSEFDGGGTYFEAAQRTITIKQGDMLCHSGQLLHGGHMITRGKRFILVGFIDVIGYHPGLIAQQQQQQQQQQAATSANSSAAPPPPSATVVTAAAKQ